MNGETEILESVASTPTNAESAAVSVEVLDASKVFPGNVYAVRGLSLTVLPGELLVLLGPSGCGKTTTLRLLAGLESPTSGRIRIGGRDVTGDPPSARGVAMVFQSAALYPHWSVHQNLAFGLHRQHRGKQHRGKQGRVKQDGRASRQEIDDGVRRIAARLMIEHLLTRRVPQLSAGQRQRVALGRAMLRRPGVMLLDEPLASLDAAARGPIRDDLRAIHEADKITTVYVTHDQAEAMSLADRLAVMVDGRLRQLGTPEEIHDRPSDRDVASCVGDPPMNMIDGELAGEGDAITFRTGTWAFSLPTIANGLKGRPRDSRVANARVAIGIRPGDIALAGGKSPDRGSRGDVVSAEARVTRVEFRGESVIGHLELGAAAPTIRLFVRLAAGSRPRVGENITITMDAGRMHWFDAATGENLGLPKRG